MRPLIALVLLPWPLHAAADQAWAVQYLANQGGTRDMVVPHAERQMAEAYVDNDDGLRIRIGCRVLHESGKLRTTGYVALARKGAMNGSFLGREADLTATFDESAERGVGRFEYARGGYWADLPPQVVALLVSHATVSLRDSQSGFVADFPLAGAGSAISRIECRN